MISLTLNHSIYKVFYCNFLKQRGKDAGKYLPSEEVQEEEKQEINIKGPISVDLYPYDFQTGAAMSPPFLFALLLPLLVLPSLTSTLEFRYHSNQEVALYLQQVNASNPDVTHLYSIGRSVLGKFRPPTESVFTRPLAISFSLSI